MFTTNWKHCQGVYSHMQLFSAETILEFWEATGSTRSKNEKKITTKNLKKEHYDTAIHTHQTKSTLYDFKEPATIRDCPGEFDNNHLALINV